MKVVITGGAGFLGMRLARRLLERGQLTGTSGRQEPIDEIVLLDVVAASGIEDKRISTMVGDIADPAVIARALDAATSSVFHLAAVVSGEA